MRYILMGAAAVVLGVVSFITVPPASAFWHHHVIVYAPVVDPPQYPAYYYDPGFAKYYNSDYIFYNEYNFYYPPRFMMPHYHYHELTD